MQVEKTSFKPTYRREERGIFVLNAKDIPLPADYPGRDIVNIVHFGPHSWGGNHRHAHREVFVGFGDGLYLVWRDEDGQKQEAKMTGSGEALYAFIVSAHVPHVIENRSDSTGIVYEIRDSQEEAIESLSDADDLLKR
jgi:hypothetical protein